MSETETEPIPNRDLVLSKKENVLNNNTAKTETPLWPPPALEEQYEAIRKWKSKPKPTHKEPLAEPAGLFDHGAPVAWEKQKEQKKKTYYSLLNYVGY